MIPQSSKTSSSKTSSSKTSYCKTHSRNTMVKGWLAGMPFALSILAGIPVAYAADPAAGLVITSCMVFAEHNEKLAYDCLAEARKSCPGPGTCELPIGMNLTAGKDIDANPETWELVKVEFSCKGIAHLNGPHYQNDHATMTLACQK